jgi:hypothetical protein
MIKVNTSIHTLRVNSCYSEHEMFPESVIPFLVTNRFRPRVLAIQKARPIVYRAKVLGRALLATRTNANKFWMLLSGNPEVAFMSRTMTIAATASVTAIAALMSALTITATGSLPAATCASFPSTASASVAFASTPTVAAATTAAAANCATPSAGQKRKARP